MTSSDEVKLLEDLPDEIKILVKKVYDIEKSKIHMSRPMGIYDEIIKAVEETINE